MSPLYHDDEPGKYLAILRGGPGLVLLGCPDCPAVFVGKNAVHAAELLAIHQEGTCQGGREVGGDDASDPAPDPQRAADVPRLTEPPE